MTTHHWKPMLADLEIMACPSCAGTEFTELAWSDRYDMDLTTAGCNRCGLVMTNPQPLESVLDEFYKEKYRQYYQKTDTPDLSYIKEYHKDDRATYSVTFLVQRNLISANSKILDIGASEGCILKAISDIEPTTHRVAIEPNPVFGTFATSYAGCSLYKSVEDLMERGSGIKFDLIVINHVFEHVKHPVDFLMSLQPLLTPEGRIYIDVPDITEYSDLESLHIAHLYHFGPSTLRHVAERAGYRVQLLEKHRPIMHPCSLRCVVQPHDLGTISAPVNRREGWALVAQAGRRAWKYHRRSWSIRRRLKYWLTGPRVPTESLR